MGNIYLLDCTLRDGGYVNDWNFGEDTIKGFCKKITQTGIEMCEVGFLKGDAYDPNRAVFPDIPSYRNVITPKNESMLYVGMLDMSAPIPTERIIPCDSTSIDGIRVIFKKDKIDEALKYCEIIKKQGYKVFMNFVGTDQYSDTEFIEGLEKCNELEPDGVAIVDSFGLIKRKHFLRLLYLADNNLKQSIMLCYHAHNNLQQAFGNAEAFVEMNLKRDISIDACVFGMGRGAGNLNLELFAEYMNENYDTQYRIEPMLEIMDEYMGEIYRRKFWGYSLPFYLSASMGCHPNYAIYLTEKDSLTVKSFKELLSGIPKEDKERFSKEKAEKYYREYQDYYIDDKDAIAALSRELAGKSILIIAPGKSLNSYKAEIAAEIEKRKPVIVSVNFVNDDFRSDFVFSSNIRRYTKIQGKTNAKRIITSNVKDCECDYKVNFASYSSPRAEIIDNSGLMALRLLSAIGVKEVFIAGMDGYSPYFNEDYYDKSLEYKFSEGAAIRNELISKEIKEIQKIMSLHFLTPTNYDV